MESFYSIIYYRPNSLTDELLAVGLLASGGEGPFIHISRRRMDLLKKVLHPAQFTSVRRQFNALRKSVNDDRSDTKDLLLFDPNYSKERLESLSARTKGAVEYSQPVTINEWLNAALFEDLISQFMGDQVIKTKQRPLFHLKWKAFYRSNQCKNWERDIATSKIINTELDFSIDLYDAQRKLMIKGVDFDLRPETVRKRLEFIQLVCAAAPDHSFRIIHPAARSKTGKAIVESIKDTVQHIELENFTEFKKKS